MAARIHRSNRLGRETVSVDCPFPKPDGPPPITVKNLTMAYGTYVIMNDMNFTVNHGDIFIIMGGSGCGKSTLLRHMLGLNEPAKGEILYGDFNFTKAEPRAARGDAAALRRVCIRAARCGAR